MPSGKYGRFTTYKKVPDYPASHIFVIPGFAENLLQTKPIVDALAAKNFAAYTYSQPRLDSKNDGVLDHPLERQGKVALMALSELLPGLTKVAAVAHSLGTAGILKAAQSCPERFDSLILMQPVGLAGIQTFKDLFKKGLRKNRNDHRLVGGMPLNSERRFVAKAQIASMGLIVRQPLLALREAQAIGIYNIAEDIKKVVARGIPVHLVVSKHDEYFEYTEVHDQLRTLDGIVTSITILDEPHHGHSISWLDPELTSELTVTLLARP
jgi:pimeloyl-ACP methyl ester carboxylesterase